MSRQVGYLASPYSHPDPKIVAYRVKETAFMAAQLMAQGRYVFSPITMCHPMAVSSCPLPGDFNFWHDFDTNMIGRCDYMVIFPLEGWTISKGIKDEVKIAKELEKPIHVIKMNDAHIFIGYEPYRGECHA